MTRHPIDVFSFGAGLVFAVLALAYLIAPGSISMAVVFPLLLIALGIVAGLVAQARLRTDEPA